MCTKAANVCRMRDSPPPSPLVDFSLQSLNDRYRSKNCEGSKTNWSGGQNGVNWNTTVANEAKVYELSGNGIFDNGNQARAFISGEGKYGECRGIGGLFFPGLPHGDTGVKN